MSTLLYARYQLRLLIRALAVLVPDVVFDEENNEHDVLREEENVLSLPQH